MGCSYLSLLGPDKTKYASENEEINRQCAKIVFINKALSIRNQFVFNSPIVVPNKTTKVKGRKVRLTKKRKSIPGSNASKLLFFLFIDRIDKIKVMV